MGSVFCSRWLFYSFQGRGELARGCDFIFAENKIVIWVYLFSSNGLSRRVACEGWRGAGRCRRSWCGCACPSCEQENGPRHRAFLGWQRGYGQGAYSSGLQVVHARGIALDGGFVQMEFATVILHGYAIFWPEQVAVISAVRNLARVLRGNRYFGIHFRHAESVSAHSWWQSEDESQARFHWRSRSVPNKA